MKDKPLSEKNISMSLQARAETYKLLSECYYLPDENLLKSLESFKLKHGLELRELIRHMPVKDQLSDLAVDFSHLFSGPFKALATPYGSIYLDGNARIMGDSTISVGKLYQEEGLKVNIKEVPDHIAIELEFMYFLGIKEIQAQKSNDKDLQEHFKEKQSLFLNQYLEPWIFKFVNSIEIGAKTKFYKVLATTTKQFIESNLKIYAQGTISA